MALPLVPAIIAGLKALFVKVIMVFLVYFLYKLLMMYSSVVTDWAFGQISQNVNLSDATVHLTGMAAWLAQTMMLPNVISLFISFAVVRFVIGLVKG